MKKNRYYELLKPPDIPILNNKSLILLPCLGWNLGALRIKVGKNHMDSSNLLNLVSFKNSHLYWTKAPEKYKEEVIFLTFQPDSYSLNYYFVPFLEYLKELTTFRGIYSLDIRTFVIVLAVESRWEFLKPKYWVSKGMYSMLESKFANTYYSMNEDYWRIIMRAPGKKKDLEESIGMELEDNVEIWSIPDLESETLKNEIWQDLENM